MIVYIIRNYGYFLDAAVASLALDRFPASLEQVGGETDYSSTSIGKGKQNLSLKR